MYDPWVVPHLRESGKYINKPRTSCDAACKSGSGLKTNICTFTLTTCDLPPSNVFSFQPQNSDSAADMQLFETHFLPLSPPHVSLCTTVQLLWLDPALSYLLPYSSPATAPIDRDGIILHISTYCGQGCGNKHFRWHSPGVSVCGAMQTRKGGRSGRRGRREEPGGSNKLQSMSTQANTRGVKNGLVNNSGGREDSLER